MMNSIEVRVPFQCTSLLNKYFPISMYQKISIYNEKIMLKKAFSDLPKQIIKRKKSGWETPESKWFRFALKEYVYSYLSNESLKNNPYLNNKTITTMVDSHMNGKYFRNQLKVLLSFAVWYENSFKQPLN